MIFNSHDFETFLAICDREKTCKRAKLNFDSVVDVFKWLSEKGYSENFTKKRNRSGAPKRPN